MKYLLIALLLISINGCFHPSQNIVVRSQHDGVDDEYSRGFLNCLAIVQQRYDSILIKHGVKAIDLPYWNECKRSYLSGQDLFNYWDTTYNHNKYP